MCVTATSFVRGLISRVELLDDRARRRGSIATHFSTTPCRSRRKCQGTMLA